MSEPNNIFHDGHDLIEILTRYLAIKAPFTSGAYLNKQLDGGLSVSNNLPTFTRQPEQIIETAFILAIPEEILEMILRLVVNPKYCDISPSGLR
jgi:hypothetical protein